MMLRLDALIRRRRRLVIAAWVVLLAAALPFAARQSDNLTSGGFAVPGSQSIAVERALARDFPGTQRAALGVVVLPQAGATAAQRAAALDRVAAAADAVEDVSLPARALAAAQRDVRRDGPVVVPLRVATTEDEANDVAIALREELGVATGARDGVRMHLVGQGALWAGLQEISKEDLEAAEKTGFPLVLLILLGVFGSLAAAALPLALGAFSVLITGALIYLLSLTMDMSVFVTNMASMIGIGVAVDYSLFVLARYREEIVAGQAPDQACARAMATSGLAVVFSGVTVIVSLAGLWMIDNNAIRSMALGAILVVAVSVLGAATLLPALMRTFGHRAYARSKLFTSLSLALRSRGRRRPGSTAPGAPERPDFWTRWTRAVMRRPVLSVVLVGGLLLVLAIPALSLETGAGALRQFPPGYETRAGFEAAARVVPPGETAPLKVVVRGGDAAAERVAARLRRDPAVARVAGVQRSRDGRSSLVTAIPRADGEAAETKAAVDRLRAALPAAAGAGTRVDVGGVSAEQRDSEQLIAGSMWKVLLFVLGLSYIVLLVLLRSAVLPLKAVLMNLLSVGAAYGVLVAVFQWGWFDGFMGFQSPGHIDTLTPPLVLAVVFGLSMDYEVFLLSRIRERYQATGDTRRAVAEGLARSARTITSAALIMVAVFAVFVGTGVPSIKEIGLGNAVAIAIDATLVRLVLVPAAMELMGRWNWWLPRPLGRILPDTSFEELPSRPEPAAA
ncbi:MAG TPA: MMPL family transporter [Solirubrobacteraceae bacterium]|nr:MMPL family transporter [Solirubrobacteraceae bacterium]